MKKLHSFIFSIAIILANFLGTTPAFAGANDFYFKKFNADYYLTHQKDGSSEMAVEETLTAVFPSSNQNHGIERVIPFLNQDDTNLTMESATALDIKVTRNGESEPFTIKTYDNRFVVRIGNPETYVHGENTYVLKYKFIHVITDFSLSNYADEAYQELYWDSNGTGWSQRFDEVNVNLHMDKNSYKNLKSDKTISKSANYKSKTLIHENNETKEKLAAWCYVGKYGASNQDRCKITDLKDGINFNAKNLKSGENLTFVTNFNKDTFEIPKNDYIKELSYGDINIDYYLSKDENGHAKMKVVEKYQVLFPTRNIERDFTRKIPFVNNSGVSFITKSQEHLNANLTMDGKSVEFSEYADGDGYFYVSTNNDDYLHGKHDFVLTYDYQDNIISSPKLQMLAIDPSYKLLADVENIKVTLHLEGGLEKELEKVKFEDQKDGSVASCKAGKKTKETYSKNSCDFSVSENTIVFTTGKLAASSSNFFITTYFKDGTFTLPEPNRNYVYYHVFGLVVVLCGAAFFIVYKKAYRKVGDKIKYLKNLPLVPQYTPHKDLTAGQAAEIYMKHTKNPRVATMLELIINKKLELVRGEKKTFGGYKWSGKVIDLTDISKEQDDVLRVLNDGGSVRVGDTFEIVNHSYSSTLERAFKDYDRHIKRKLEDDDYFEKNTKDKTTPLHFIGIYFACIFAFFVLMIFSVFFIDFYKEITNFTPFSIYEGEDFLPIIIFILFATLLLLPILSGMISKYKIRTEKGLEVTRYLDGLKLYIKMAEKERLEFLQSVENVDTSEEGIVKLNEKLLPYAALFGLEKSWMKELEKYYELHESSVPDWYTAGFTYSVIHSVAHVATSRPIDTSSSSGWSSGGSYSSSSSSSGGGGGGFSGGGGGGGGGGGW